VRQCSILRLEQRAAVGPVGDLQNEPIAATGTDQEVLIALARERRRGSVHAEHLPREGYGFAGGDRRRVPEDIHQLRLSANSNGYRSRRWNCQ
jgi:hypothetical protein